MKKDKIGAVIAVAGMSSRMKDFKPLMKIENKTIIETTVENYKRAGVDEILLVTGYRGSEIEEVLKDQEVDFVRNTNYESTHMFDSISMGLREIKDKVNYVFLSPGDSPFVQQFTLKKMIEEIENSKIKLVQPSYEGEDGHPLLLKKDAFSTVLEHDGTMGLQGVINKMSRECKNICFIDPGIILDADIKLDYAKLLTFNDKKDCLEVDVCRKIQDYFQMTDAVRRHSNKVAQKALDLYEHLSSQGITLDKKIILGASLLHDIAKGRAHHEKVGAQWLMDMGYKGIADIISEHMELNEIPSIITEKEVVFLADKLVKEDNFVTIEERFSFKENMYKNDELVLKAVKRKKEQAETVYKMIFKDYKEECANNG